MQQNFAISVPTLSQIAAEAAFDGRAEMEAVKHGYERNRRILVEGLPAAGLEKFLPVDGAFYLYADVSRFTNDSFEFAKRMLEQAGVAVTPGVDFDPFNGQKFIRLCYAGAESEITRRSIVSGDGSKAEAAFACRSQFDADGGAAIFRGEAGQP